MKKWRTDLLIIIGLLAFFTAFFFLAWKPARLYKENCEVFCDSLKRLHGFYDVRIESIAQRFPFSDYHITLRGVIDNREDSRQYARCFANNVAINASGIVDSVLVIYAGDSTVFRTDRFGYDQLIEK